MSVVARLAVKRFLFPRRRRALFVCRRNPAAPRPAAVRRRSRLILFITLADIAFALKYLLTAVAWLAGARADNASFGFILDECRTAAAWGQFWAMASASWNVRGAQRSRRGSRVCRRLFLRKLPSARARRARSLQACWIADFLFILQNPLRNTSSNRRYYHVYVWSACVVTTAVVMGLGARGTTTNYACWLRGDSTEELAFLVPLAAYMALGLLSLIYAAVRLRRGAGVTLVARRSLLYRHAAYVLAFLFLWTWPILHAQFDNNDDILALSVMDALVISLQGFVFAAIRLSEPGAWFLLTIYSRAALDALC